MAKGYKEFLSFILGCQCDLLAGLMSNITKKKVTFKVPECEIRLEPEDQAQVLRDCRISQHRKVALIRLRFGRIIEPVLSNIHRIIVWRAQHVDLEFASLSAIPPLTKSQICEMRKVSKYPRHFTVPAWFVQHKRLVNLEQDAWYIWKLCRDCHLKDVSGEDES